MRPIQPDAPAVPAVPAAPRARLVAVCGGGAALIGALSLLPRVAVGSLMAFPAGARPLALWAAADMVLLGLGLVALALLPRRRAARRAAAATAGVVLASALLAVLAHLGHPALDPERVLAAVIGPQGWGDVDGTRSLAIPVVAAAGAALLLLALGRFRDAAGASALLVTLVGLAVCVGFLVGSPVLRSTPGPRVAVSAALAIVFAGFGLLGQAGPAAWPTRTLTGESVRAVLLRGFLPAVVVALLVTDIATMLFLSRTSNALASAINALVSVALAMLVIYGLAPVVGKRVAGWERALRESEERFRLLSDAAFEGVAIIEHGTVVDGNDDLANMLGYRREELIGRSVAELVAPEHVALVLERQRAQTTERHEYRMRRKDGSTFPAEVQGRTMPYHGRQVRVAAIRDVTEARRLEDQVRRTQRMEAIGQFAGGIAHDFNNLLTAVLASSSMLEAGLPLGSPLLDDVETIRGAARRGADLSQKLLAYGRRRPLELRPVCVRSAAENLVGLARRMVPENIEIVLRPAPEDITVRADAGALDQILLNCITNARDAMPTGGKIVVAISRATLDETHRRTRGWGRPGTYVTVAVTDTGVGMDPETRRHAFEPFFTTKPVGQNSGLGLAMVYGLIKQHAGFVDLESQPGRGTTVLLYLPDAADAVPAAVRGDAAATPGGHETILVVEDDQDVRLATVRVLRKFGYEVLTAGDGAEALALLGTGRHRPDLIFSDVVMPRVSGPQLLTRLREAGSAPRILFTSGYVSRDASLEQQVEPGLRVLSKPWTVAELLEAVRDALDEAP